MQGIDFGLASGYAWAEDKEHCEEYGRMLQADPRKVSMRAKKRGLPQLGTLGRCHVRWYFKVFELNLKNEVIESLGIMLPFRQ